MQTVGGVRSPDSGGDKRTVAVCVVPQPGIKYSQPHQSHHLHHHNHHSISSSLSKESKQPVSEFGSPAQASANAVDSELNTDAVLDPSIQTFVQLDNVFGKKRKNNYFESSSPSQVKESGEWSEHFLLTTLGLIKIGNLILLFEP